MLIKKVESYSALQKVLMLLELFHSFPEQSDVVVVDENDWGFSRFFKQRITKGGTFNLLCYFVEPRLTVITTGSM